MSGNMHNKVDCCVGVQQENPIYNSICLQDPVSRVDGESRQMHKVSQSQTPSRSPLKRESTEIVNDGGKSNKLLCQITRNALKKTNTSLLILYNSKMFN